MMQNLLLEEGDLIEIESASLPVATYSKFQPQNVDFLDISNPKAVYPFKSFLFKKREFSIKRVDHPFCELSIYNSNRGIE